MPIYEYECQRCHHRFEVKQSFQDDPEVVCPQCQGTARRLLHRVGIIFKGSGFYTTDNRKHTDYAKDSDKETKAEGSRPEAD